MKIDKFEIIMYVVIIITVLIGLITGSLPVKAQNVVSGAKGNGVIIAAEVSDELK